jgi:hypothetical protein
MYKSKNKFRKRFFVAFLFAFLFIGLFIFIERTIKFENRFASLKKGDTRALVVKLLGTPQYVVDFNNFCLLQENPKSVCLADPEINKKITKVFIYNDIGIAAYQISFNDNNLIEETYYCTSP